MSNEAASSQQAIDNAATAARKQVDHYINDLSAITGDPSSERVSKIIKVAAMNILSTILEKTPPTITGSIRTDYVLELDYQAATRAAQDAVVQATHCNIASIQTQLQPGESREEWIHRMAHPLHIVARTLRDVHRGVLNGCTGSLQRTTGPNTEARAFVNRTNAHVGTAIDMATNVDAIRERMPPIH